MPIDFTPERWARVKEESAQWWSGTLKRPLLQMRVGGRDPGRPKPRHPHHHFTAFHDASVSADEIVDCWDYELCCQKFLGDAFPTVWPNFGPGVLAGFLGAKLENGENTVWFHPLCVQEIGEIHFKFDPENIWVRRIADIYRAGIKRWGNLVQMGMTDLGGAVDVLSTFRPSERLLLDLYDHPDEVKRLTAELHEFWWQHFNYFDGILREGGSQGWTAWASVFSQEPYYMLQCDFCYMIGPEMFDEFVAPELECSCRKLKNGFYHLDGKGELPHLPALLKMDALKGIQWIPGAGQPACDEWPEVWRAVVKAGKKGQFFAGLAEMDKIAAQTGKPEAFVAIGGGKASEEQAIAAGLRKWGVK